MTKFTFFIRIIKVFERKRKMHFMFLNFLTIKYIPKLFLLFYFSTILLHIYLP